VITNAGVLQDLVTAIAYADVVDRVEKVFTIKEL
jgi:hypothetical protein